MRLIDISNQLNYNTSTTLRFLNSLERNGYVYKDRETLKYQMTYKLCGLASHISNRTGIVEIASGPMKQLSTNLGECVCLAVEQDYTCLLYTSPSARTCLHSSTLVQRVTALCLGRSFTV